jgi:hypothetical protein
LAQEHRAEEARRAANHSAHLGPTSAVHWSSDVDAGSISFGDMEDAATAFIGWLSSLLRKPH